MAEGGLGGTGIESRPFLPSRFDAGVMLVMTSARSVVIPSKRESRRLTHFGGRTPRVNEREPKRSLSRKGL